MTKERVKALLSTKKSNFYFVVKGLSDFISVYENKVSILNAIVKKAKANKNFSSLDLYRFFYEELKDIVEGTPYARSKYSAQMLLKSVWESTRFQNLVIKQIKNNYRIIELPKKEETKEDKELRKRERLIKQAAIMREAKARKAAAKKIIKAKKEDSKNNEQKPSSSNSNSNSNSNSAKDKNDKKPTKEQLELLRNLRA